jgi:urease accessory protein
VFALLHLCDSLFPIGAFSHSDGLEAATASGAIQSGRDLKCWIDTCLEQTLGTCDGPAVARAWRLARNERWLELDVLDAEMHAMRPSSAGRQASRAMGTRLVKTWRQIRPESCPEGLLERAGAGLTLPVAFGAVCASSGIDARGAVEGFFYTRLAAMVSSAMRLIPIGQHEAHSMLAEALARATPRVDGILAGDAEASMFAPALDVAAMGQQYVLSRLFKS